MKRLVAVAVLAACTDPKTIELLPDSTRAFSPANVSLARSPEQCGNDSAPFSSGDAFSLVLVGAPSSGTGLATAITVTFHPTLPVGQSLPVDLGELGVIGSSPGGASIFGQSGALPLANNAFSWVQGPDPSEIDATPLATVSIRIDKLPEAEGDLGILTIRMAYTDGGVYDVQVGTRATTPLAGCAGEGDQK